jgi:EMAP domain
LLLSFYNPDVLGDVLIVETAEDVATQDVTQKDNVVRIFNQENEATIGFNFFGLGKELGIENDSGQVFLDEKQVGVLNDALAKAGFSDKLEADNSPKFVIGHVDEIKDHPNSDHLHITKTDVGLDNQFKSSVVHLTLL